MVLFILAREIHSSIIFPAVLLVVKNNLAINLSLHHFVAFFFIMTNRNEIDYLAQLSAPLYDIFANLH